MIGLAHVADIAQTDDLSSDGASWWTHARCNDGNGGLVDVFFSRELHDIARAKRLCLSCPALVPCLEGALERREPWGVWGGQLFVDGTIVAIKRRPGRPPNVPRPTDRLPEVPLPEHLRALPDTHRSAAVAPRRRRGRAPAHNESRPIGARDQDPRQSRPSQMSGPRRLASVWS